MDPRYRVHPLAKTIAMRSVLRCRKKTASINERSTQEDMNGGMKDIEDLCIHFWSVL